jgi:hypothetical protein
VQTEAAARVREPHGCGKARDSGANDMDGLLHQMKA